MSQQANVPSRPRPRIDEESRPWWEALGRRELCLQRCLECGALRWYPRALCPECLCDRTQWVRASGRGKVYSLTTVHQNQAAGFAGATPYLLAYVELEEGVRILTNVVNCRPEEVTIGASVEAVFQDIGNQTGLLSFQPTRQQA